MTRKITFVALVFLFAQSRAFAQQPVVAVLLAVMFGGLALLEMPIQMRPTIDQPQISVQVDYPGVAPPEIEAQITTPR